MRRLTKTLGGTVIPYYVKGKFPSLLIHAGTHGDEYGVIESVRLAVEKYELLLPDFVYVPVFSPSAVNRKTRVNEQGLDLNRNCLEKSSIAEIEANFAIVEGQKFKRLATFHEDSSKNDFYLYDINGQIRKTTTWEKFATEVEALGVGMFDGVDDMNDPVLNYSFERGYHYFPIAAEGYYGGSFDAWAIRNGVIKEALVPEIPGKLLQKKKNEIVELFFESFLVV